MMSTITITDQTTFGRDSQTMILDFEPGTEAVTVRELIRRRVYVEVSRYNRELEEESTFFRGLVQPNDADITRNGFRMRSKRPINWETQYDLALEAFLSNGFLLLVNDRQVDELGELIEITPLTQVVFFKLIPLVGG